MNTIKPENIRRLRKEKSMSQKDLAERMNISEKTVSKWETGRGLPDSGLIQPLADALGVTITELFSGTANTNTNRSADLKKTKFYVCPKCGNIIQSVGEGSFACCGQILSPLQAEDEDDAHTIEIEPIENEYFIHTNHPMTKTHAIVFFAYVTGDCVQFIRLYPEQSPDCRFMRRGHGILYVCCSKHGLYKRLL